ncbi:unnamed protein product [Linum tenue]|uniref:Uncharacterized protein n=1 Tax=Linum tenue TaxID=586396 RepID=A0AAV0MTV6_9ROSI|nr:unnamed protein product [Linum tenue]
MAPPSKAIVYNQHAQPDSVVRDMADLCPKQEAVWLKVDIDSPIEYAATIIVNLLTALLMIEDITTLNSGDSVVQNGATSIVCQCFVQLGHLRSICSINITRDRCFFKFHIVKSVFFFFLPRELQIFESACISSFTSPFGS